MWKAETEVETSAQICGNTLRCLLPLPHTPHLGPKKRLRKPFQEANAGEMGRWNMRRVQSTMHMRWDRKRLVYVRVKLKLIDKLEVGVCPLPSPSSRIIRQLLGDGIEEARPAGCGTDFGDVVGGERRGVASHE
jgi:hypothetical protein